MEPVSYKYSTTGVSDPDVQICFTEHGVTGFCIENNQPFATGGLSRIFYMRISYAKLLYERRNSRVTTLPLPLSAMPPSDCEALIGKIAAGKLQVRVIERPTSGALDVFLYEKD